MKQGERNPQDQNQGCGKTSKGQDPGLPRTLAAPLSRLRSQGSEISSLIRLFHQPARLILSGLLLAASSGWVGRANCQTPSPPCQESQPALLAPESSLGDHDTAQEHYSRGAQLLAEGKDSAAEVEFRTSWLTHPRNPSYVRTLTLFYIQRRRYQDALDVLRGYVKSCGATALGYELEAELLFQQHIYASALEAAERSLALNDKNARMHEVVGLVFGADHQIDAAVPELAKATELDPHNPQIHYWYGRTLYTTGRIPEAIEQFLTCLKIQPYYPRALENLGLCYDALRDDSKAIEAYEKAIAHEAGKSGPKDVQPYAYCAVLLNERGQIDRGLELLREAVKLDPDSFRVNYELGRLLLAKRDLGGADIYLQRAMKLSPNFPRTYYLLAQLRQRQKQPKAAAAYYRQFEQLNQIVANRDFPADQPAAEVATEKDTPASPP